MTDLTLIQGGKSDTVTVTDTTTNTAPKKELNDLNITVGLVPKQPGMFHTMDDVLSAFEDIMDDFVPMVVAHQAASLGLSYGQYSTMIIQTKIVKTVMVKHDYEMLLLQFGNL